MAAGDESEALTLEQSIALALRQNGDTLAANRSFAAASQSVRAARSDLYPQVSGTANYAYSSQNNSVTTIDNTGGGSNTFSTRSGQTTTGLNLSQNLFDGGRVRTQVRQAQASALGAAGNVGTARNALAYEVAQRFYEQLRQSRLVTQRQGQVALAQSQLALVQAQFQAGSVARSDIQSVLVNVSQAQLDLSTAKNDLRVAQTNFRNSLGLERGAALVLRDDLPASALPTAQDLQAIVSPTSSATADGATTNGATANGATVAAPVSVPVGSSTIPAAPTLDALESYVALADRLRPDILQARASLQSAQASTKLAQINARPQITASAGYTVDPRDTGTRGFTFSTGLSLPVFDAGGRRASVNAAKDSAAAAQINLEQTRKDVAADVEAAYVDIVGQQDRLQNARTLLEQARVNLENATAKYRAGAGIILDIVNAQTQLFNAQNTYTGIVYDAQTSRLNLDRATGRFAWADPDQNAPAAAPATLQSAAQTLSRLSAASTVAPAAAPSSVAPAIAPAAAPVIVPAPVAP